MRLFILTTAFCFFAGCSPAAAPNATANNSRTGGSGQTTAEVSPSASPARNPSPEPSPQLGPQPTVQSGVREAADVVGQYYGAINSRDYRRAYRLWSGEGEASKQTFEELRNGFANTESVEVETMAYKSRMEGAAGSQYATIPVRIKAKTKAGNEQDFSGEYVLRRSMVDGATPEQRSWRIHSANISEQVKQF